MMAATGAAGAATAATVVAWRAGAASQAQPAVDAQEAAARREASAQAPGYQLTDHVAHYYRTTRL